MDPEAFLDMANQLFEKTLEPELKHFLAKSISMLAVDNVNDIFGGMVANGLLGEPILAPLKNTPQLLVGTIVWYVVFYTLFDIGYKVGKFYYADVFFDTTKIRRMSIS